MHIDEKFKKNHKYFGNMNNVWCLMNYIYYWKKKYTFKYNSYLVSIFKFNYTRN